jgi:hypothetical protein
MFGFFFLLSLALTIIKAIDDPSWIVITILILCIGMFVLAFEDNDKLKGL